MGWIRLEYLKLTWNRMTSGRIKKPIKYVNAAAFERDLQQRLRPGSLHRITTLFSDNIINQTLRKASKPKKVFYHIHCILYSTYDIGCL